jgi:hypothetical protein
MPVASIGACHHEDDEQNQHHVDERRTLMSASG